MDRTGEVKFPKRGLDVSQDVSGQPALTTPVGINVRVYEPSTSRGRGGSRPGTTKLPPGQVPSGLGVIQHLNTVVTTDSTNVPTGVEDPGAPTIDDPSSPGGPELWGSDPLYIDPDTGDSQTGQTLGSRAPAPPGQKAKRRDKGSGYQPNPNQLTQAPPPVVGSYYCTTILATYRAHVPAPNIGGFDGQLPTFSSTTCEFWTTIDEGGFPAAVAGNKSRIAAKADEKTPIVVGKQNYLAKIFALGNPSATLEFVGASVPFTPSAFSACDPHVANSCGDPNG